jgi:hypothetical protein
MSRQSFPPPLPKISFQSDDCPFVEVSSSSGVEEGVVKMAKQARSLTLALRNWISRNREAVRLRQECEEYGEILADLTATNSRKK